MAAPEASMPFIKNLASSDRRLRASATTTLRTFLLSLPVLSEPDALKLWQGLFYALWMADRPAAQQALCSDLAALAERLPSAAALAAWLRAFWVVMARRWGEIDAHRMSKFMLLVRRVLGASLGLLLPCRAGAGVGRRDGGGGGGAVEDVVVDSLRSFALERTGDVRAAPLGLRLHVLDIWVDECERAGLLGDEAGEEDRAVGRRVGELVEEVEATCLTKAVRARAKESLDDERIWWRDRGEGRAGEDDESWDGIED